MTNSREHWNQEYSKGSPHFRALSSDQPSISAKRLIEYLQETGTPASGRLLEVGCGRGRNTNWLIQKGWETVGVDISEVAIFQAKKIAKEAGLPVDYRVLDISQPWPFVANFFDVIFDSVTSHLLTLTELKSYQRQIKRTLKKDGLFIIYTLDRTQDQTAQELLQESPGPEPNTYVIPEMGHIERTYTSEELKTLFKPLKLRYSELIHRPTQFGDQFFDRYYWWVVFKR